MKARIFALIVTLGIGAASTTVSEAADACGPINPSDQVTWVIQDHFNALNAHDRARLLSVWKENASVVSEGPPMVIEPIEQAATRWLAAKHPVTFEVGSIEVHERNAIAHVNVVFEGRQLADTIYFKENANNTWQIAGKSSRDLHPATRATAFRY
jgi:hypothetical protein